MPAGLPLAEPPVASISPSVVASADCGVSAMTELSTLSEGDQVSRHRYAKPRSFYFIWQLLNCNRVLIASGLEFGHLGMSVEGVT